MLPVALEYPPGDCNGSCVYRPARGERLCEPFGGCKTINRILFFFVVVLQFDILPKQFLGTLPGA